jgi:hypothetical protein
LLVTSKKSLNKRLDQNISGERLFSLVISSPISGMRSTMPMELGNLKAHSRKFFNPAVGFLSASRAVEYPTRYSSRGMAGRFC